MKSRIALVFGVALLVSAAFGQDSIRVNPSPAGGVTGTATFTPPPFAVTAITGAPYSGEEASERSQTLIDGTHIFQQTPGRRLYRDSLGRTRTERPLFLGLQVTDPPVLIEITDPVAGFQYTLDTENRVAHRAALPRAETSARAAAPQAPAVARPRSSESQPQVSSEPLGTRMIEGVLVEGRRITTTLPAGMQGNDRPIVLTTEAWVSPDLKTTVLSKTFDPRAGENTFKIVHLSRLEPDPILFQPPPDYSMVDEKGEFTITCTRQ
jgi:hypothetical protein